MGVMGEMDIGTAVKAALARTLRFLFEQITHTGARPLGFVIMAIPDRDMPGADVILVAAYSDERRRKEMLRMARARLDQEMRISL